MSQTERIGRIRAILKEKGYFRVNDIRKIFEVSRITVMRDIAYMRDRLGTPLTYEPVTNVYRLSTLEDMTREPEEFPGLWLSPDEAYAVLTLFNIMSKFVPGFIRSLITPLRIPLKRMLGTKDFRMYGLDQKIDIDLPRLLGHRNIDLNHIYSALLECTQVSLTWLDETGAEVRKTGLVTKLSLSTSGWAFHFRFDHREPTSIPSSNILECEPLATFIPPNPRTPK